jgi:hypothetical protein
VLGEIGAAPEGSTEPSIAAPKSATAIAYFIVCWFMVVSSRTWSISSGKSIACRWPIKNLDPECSKRWWGRIRGFVVLSELTDPPLYSRRDLADYLAQVLSAFKAASAEAFVVWAAPTTFMLPPVAGWLSTI